MHIPLRMCIACRQMKEKGELIRLRKCGDDVEIDKSGKKNGRGAYICRNEECIKTAKKRRALSKHFKTAVEDSFYDAVEEVLCDE
ncbi:MAG: YlxR family protein [Clostridia bacterium]|nr:YlxR family protein [Clostridia bacterium]